jgi:hypothetical protein
MAKTIQHKVTREVRRVSDSEAEHLVEKEGWRYIGKMEGRRLLQAAQIELERKRA